MASQRRPRVAVIGAGFSGLAVGVALQQQGIEDFVIFERASGLGGTWFANRYPGAEVDLESHIYSFSFEKSSWSGTHADWRELLAYLELVADKWDLTRRIHLNEAVTKAEWSDEHQHYTITTSTGEHYEPFTAVVSAVGFLNRPLIPPFLRETSEFRGEICHTSTWREGISFEGKRVGVLGTGSSAVQVVTEAQKVATSVTIFQIEPNWILPKSARKYTPTERRRMARPLRYSWERLKLYLGYDLRQMRTSHARASGLFNQRRKAASLAFVNEELKDRPDLLELVIPDFPFEARRTVTTDTYYATLKQPNVRLVPYAASEIYAEGLVDAEGEKHQLDVIVMATGFDTSVYVNSCEVKGEGGIDLQEQWAGEPRALFGLMVPKFPNFFMMFGPNTNAIPLISFYEAQARFAARSIHSLGNKYTRIEAKPSAYATYNRWIQRKLSKTVWQQVDSYFRGTTGRVISQWPLSASTYIWGTRLLRGITTRRR